MKILYFDCFSGISGDMVLGAMVDAGVNVESLKSGLKKLDLEGCEIKVSKVKRRGIAGTKVDVIVDEKRHIHHTSYKDIKELVERSSLSDKVKTDSLRIFKRIAEAEAKVHNTSVEHVHFHEVGAVDSIVDVVGAAIGINLLSPNVIISSPINTGKGATKTEHGLLPVPAPAAAEMLKGFPSYSSDTAFELATPTGVGIITTLSKEFSAIPMMITSAIGYGAGSRDFPDSPNLLRIMLGEAYSPVERDTITAIESNIDDMNPQFYDYVMDRLFEGGALDVFLTPIIMKKNRPAVKITILSDNDKVDSLASILLSETTSFGVRIYRTERIKLEREIKTITTEYGDVKVKIGKRDGRIVNTAPEYEDCKRIAKERGISIREVYEKIGFTANNFKI